MGETFGSVKTSPRCYRRCAGGAKLQSSEVVATPCRRVSHPPAEPVFLPTAPSRLCGRHNLARRCRRDPLAPRGFADANNRHNRAPFASRQIATQISDFPRFTRPSSLSQFARRGHIYRKHTGTDCRSQRRTDGRDGGGGVLKPGAVRVTMSVRRIKTWIDDSRVCRPAGFGGRGRPRVRRQGVQEEVRPCATRVADPCGASGRSLLGPARGDCCGTVPRPVPVR